MYSAVSVIEDNESYSLYIEPVTVDATIQFAATLAKFSYLYQNYDRDFATQCLRASDKAYRLAALRHIPVAILINMPAPRHVDLYCRIFFELLIHMIW